jgi:Na+/proline symporter
VTVHFAIYDYLLIALYFLVVLFIGFKTKSADKSNLDYIVAGRQITLPAFVATLVATFYGGILGVGEFTYRFGIAGWFLYALPNYFFIVLFALFLAKRIRKSKMFTIPEKLESVYGKRVGILGAIYVFFLITPAPYVFMLGIIVKLVFGISLIYSMIICLLISVAYLYKGGLKADVRVNIFEFILMFAGFGIIIPFCISGLGGFDYLQNNLPAENLSLTGSYSFQYILVWFFIGAWALVDPSFHQRCYAAKTESTARNGVYISLIFWFIFDFMTTTAGLYAAASYKNLQEPSMSYPLLAESILPPIAKGLFFIGMIATIMSTLHSYVFVSATTLGKDIVARLMGNEAGVSYSKIGIIVTSAISLIIAILLPSVVEMWYTIGTLFIPPLLMGIISSYFNKLIIRGKFMYYAMLVSFFVSLASFIYGNIFKTGSEQGYFFGLEPIYPGFFAGIIVYLWGFFKKTELADK